MFSASGRPSPSLGVRMLANSRMEPTGLSLTARRQRRIKTYARTPHARALGWRHVVIWSGRRQTKPGRSAP